MKYIITILIIALIAFSFTKKECSHIYVQVAKLGEIKDTIQVDVAPFNYSSVYPIGIIDNRVEWVEDGGSYACIKCFHVVNQKIKYKRESMPPTLNSLLEKPKHPVIDLSTGSLHYIQDSFFNYRESILY